MGPEGAGWTGRSATAMVSAAHGVSGPPGFTQTSASCPRFDWRASARWCLLGPPGLALFLVVGQAFRPDMRQSGFARPEGPAYFLHTRQVRRAEFFLAGGRQANAGHHDRVCVKPAPAFRPDTGGPRHLPSVCSCGLPWKNADHCRIACRAFPNGPHSRNGHAGGCRISELLCPDWWIRRRAPLVSRGADRTPCSTVDSFPAGGFSSRVGINGSRRNRPVGARLVRTRRWSGLAIRSGGVDNHLAASRSTLAFSDESRTGNVRNKSAATPLKVHGSPR